MDVIVVGAGPAGLTAARVLQDAGRSVLVLEKSRGAGGRCCTRRTDHGRFDHGAPVLHLDDGPLVPVPRVSAYGRALAEGLDVRTQARVAAVVPGAVVLEDGRRLEAPQILVCTPAPQAVELLPDGPARAAAAQATYDPCWTVMAVFPAPVRDVADTVAGAGPVRWAHREGARPGRVPEGERWVVQAHAAWSAAHLEDDPGVVGPQLLAAFTAATGAVAGEPTALIAHRWRYATVAAAAGVPCVLQEDGIGAAGDWCLGARVQDALDSGAALAAAVLA